jgi:hypothetical protein
VFPKLSPDALIEKLVSLWGELGDRGAFRDAVKGIFHHLTDESRDKALPRVHDILASSEYSAGARPPLERAQTHCPSSVGAGATDGVAAWFRLW